MDEADAFCVRDDGAAASIRSAELSLWKAVKLNAKKQTTTKEQQRAATKMARKYFSLLDIE